MALSIKKRINKRVNICNIPSEYRDLYMKLDQYSNPKKKDQKDLKDVKDQKKWKSLPYGPFRPYSPLCPFRPFFK
jgi:hypothetical protein